MAAMPQTKEAIQRILQITEQQLALAEAQILKTLTDGDRDKAIALATDLKVKIRELRDLVTEQ